MAAHNVHAEMSWVVKWTLYLSTVLMSEIVPRVGARVYLTKGIRVLIDTDLQALLSHCCCEGLLHVAIYFSHLMLCMCSPVPSSHIQSVRRVHATQVQLCKGRQWDGARTPAKLLAAVGKLKRLVKAVRGTLRMCPLLKLPSTRPALRTGMGCSLHSALPDLLCVGESCS